jgi:hypothetical protein
MKFYLAEKKEAIRMLKIAYDLQIDLSEVKRYCIEDPEYFLLEYIVEKWTGQEEYVIEGIEELYGDVWKFNFYHPSIEKYFFYHKKYYTMLSDDARMLIDLIMMKIYNNFRGCESRTGFTSYNIEDVENDDGIQIGLQYIFCEIESSYSILKTLSVYVGLLEAGIKIYESYGKSLRI